MGQAIQRIRLGAALAMLLLMLLGNRTLQAEPTPPCPSYPCGPGGVCIPNAMNFGYFRTIWRRWPGEPRPAEDFPQSIGREVLVTPKAEVPKEPIPAPIRLRGEQGLPGGGLPGLPSPGGFGEGGILPDFGQPQGSPLEMPAEPGSILPPDPFGGLPGTIPGLPSTDPGTTVPSTDPAPSTAPSGPPAGLPSVGPPQVGPPSTESPGSGLPVDPIEESPLPGTQIPSGTSSDGAALPQVLPPRLTTTEGPLVREVAKAAVDQRGPSLNSSLPKVVQMVPSEPRSLPAGPADSARLAPQLSRQSAPQPLQANWAEALHPGFRGDVGRSIRAKPMTQPARPVMHQESIQVHPALGTPMPSGNAARMAEPDDDLPLVIEGFCPVTLGQKEQWVQGNSRWAALHRGRTYHFAGSAQRDTFLKDPDQYVPQCSGSDPVLIAEKQQFEQGKTDFCITYDGRLYMFTSEASLQKFQQDPDHYVEAIKN